MKEIGHNGCNCNRCKLARRYKWAMIKECGCGCHKGETGDITGHSGLCCEYPNGKKKDSPYKNLKKAEFYHNQLNDDEF